MDAISQIVVACSILVPVIAVYLARHWIVAQNQTLAQKQVWSFEKTICAQMAAPGASNFGPLEECGQEQDSGNTRLYQNEGVPKRVVQGLRTRACLPQA